MATEDADDTTRAEPYDPESEACLGALAERIRWELEARIAVGDDPRTAEGRAVLAEFVADTSLDAFTVRPRTGPRYKPGPKPPYPA